IVGVKCREQIGLAYTRLLRPAHELAQIGAGVPGAGKPVAGSVVAMTVYDKHGRSLLVASDVQAVAQRLFQLYRNCLRLRQLAGDSLLLFSNSYSLFARHPLQL